MRRHGRSGAPVGLDPNHRNDDGIGGHNQRLLPRAGRDSIAVEIKSAGKVCDTDFARIDEAEILAALPSPQHHVRKARHPICGSALEGNETRT